MLENAGSVIKDKNETKSAPVAITAAEVMIESSENETIGHIAGDISVVPVAQVEANPFQPRTEFSPDALIELAQSIRELGLIQPITVRKISAKKYQIISGERRFRASQMAGLEEVPVYIRATDDQGMLEMALVENIQRENLNAIEVAISFKRLMDECSLTTETLAERVGKDRTTVTNYVRLLKLPPEIQLGIIEKRITMGHARALINIPESKQLAIFKEILDKELSVRKVEDLAKEDDAPKLFRPAKVILPVEFQKMQAELRLKYGKRAKLQRGDSGIGKLEIPFNNDDDLTRIIEMLGL